MNRNIIPYSEAEPPTDREGKDQQKHTAGGQKQVADPPNQWLLHCHQINVELVNISNMW